MNNLLRYSQVQSLVVGMDKYNLTWHSYPNHLRDMMQEMMISLDFADVTLVSDDKQAFKAHRNILSACSPMFRNILKMQSDCNHPVLYLRGIEYSVIESILQFIYLGEAKLYEEKMYEFLSAAKNLEIRELSKQSEESKPQSDTKLNEHQGATTIAENENNFIDGGAYGFTVEDSVPKVVKTEEKINKMQGSKFQCPQCEKLFSSKANVQQHIKSAHEGVKNVCNQCDNLYADLGTLRTHIRSVHEGIKYPCNQCDQHFTQLGTLRTHIQSIHEGIKYDCNQCDYQAKEKNALKKHISYRHEGVSYSCDKCNHQAATQGNLNTHIKRKHL